MTALFQTGWLLQISGHAVPVLLDVAVKGTVLLLAAGCIVLLLRRAPASFRHLVWTLAMVCLILLPVNLLPRALGVSETKEIPETLVPGGKTVPSTGRDPTLDADMQGGRMDSTAGMLQPETSFAPTSIEGSQSMKPESSGSHGSFWILAAWLAGFMVLMAPFIFGHLTVKRLIRGARLLADPSFRDWTDGLCKKLGLVGRIDILSAAGVKTPLSWGFFKPVVLLPAGAEAWPKAKLRVVLLHELAHVRRRDCMTQTLARAAMALNWFNPLVWLAMRRIVAEREMACDDMVLNRGLQPTVYADYLLEIAREVGKVSSASFAAITMARRSQLEGRLLSILDDGMNRRPVASFARSAAVLAALVLLLPLTLVQCKSSRTAREEGGGERAATARTDKARESGVAMADKAATDPGADPWEGTALGGRASLTDFPQYRGCPSRNNFRKVENRIRVPAILWKADWAPAPAAVGSDVYAGGGELRLMDLATGKVKASWKPNGGDARDNVRGTPVVLKDRVIVTAADGKVYALDRGLTKVIWSTDGKIKNFMSGVSDGEVFVVSGGTRLVALETRDGSVRWKINFSRLFPVSMSPALADGKVFFGSMNKTFYAVGVEDGEEIWSYEGEHPFGWTDPVVAFGKVFVGDRGGVVNAFDLDTGARVWSYKTGATGLSEPGIIPGNILVGFSKFIATLDEKTGEHDTSKRGFRTGFNPFGSPTLIGKTLYFGNLDGHLYAFDYETEELEWLFEVAEKQQVHDFIYHRDILLVTTTEGLYALGNDPEGKARRGYVLTSEF
jgi:outer membrane protein assembly factor BamB/beta-lactamase regulating signal transducer with metallopeptidase domain